MQTLTIDLDAIAANWRWLAERHGGPTAAVIKADAYGLGAARVAPRLLEAGARHFFVAHACEGAALRPLLPDVLIGILNGFFVDEAKAYLDHGLAPVLGNLEEIGAWRALAAQSGRTLPALIHLDTGMNRLGLSGSALEMLARAPELLAGIDVLFVMTHLANAEDPDNTANAHQARALGASAGLLPDVPRSLANSSGLLLGPDFRSGLARPGAALYGVNPTPGRANPMRPVVRLTARVLQLREIGAGEVVGYGGIWAAGRPTRVATVCVGYADGYPRSLSRDGTRPGAEAAFDGGRLPLIGRVSMDLTTFDATDHQHLRVGDAVELIGPAVPPDEVAGWAGTNGYEILTSLKPRGARVYASL